MQSRGVFMCVMVQSINYLTQKEKCFLSFLTNFATEIKPFYACNVLIARLQTINNITIILKISTMKQKLLLFLSMFLLLGGGNIWGIELSVDLSKLPATETNTTWTYDADNSKGAFAWSTTWYNQMTLTGLKGDLYKYETITIESEKGVAPDGTDESTLALDHFRFIVKFSNGTAQVTKTLEVGTTTLTWDDLGISENDRHYIDIMQLSGASDKTGNVFIKKVTLAAKDVEYIEATKTEFFNLPTGTKNLKSLTGTNTNWSNTVVPQEFMAGGKVYGDGDGSNEATHVNIDGYDYLQLYISEAQENSCGLRVWVWDDVNKKVVTLHMHPIAEAATVTDWTATTKIASSGVYVTKISGYKYLKGIKATSDWGSPSVYVLGGYLSKGAPIATSTYNTYSLKGAKLGDVLSLNEALTDKKCAYINATALSNEEPITLTPANPNCIIVAAEGKLANDKNVAVNNTVANLVLTDGYSFKAPEGLTAAKAQYERAMTTKFGTITLPFDAKSNESVQFYTVISKTANSIELKEVDELAAGTPAIMQQKGDKVSINATDVAVSNEIKEAADAVKMHGSYTMDTKVTDANAYYIYNDKFWKRSDAAEDPHFFCDAFRAYFTVEGSAAAQAKALAINVSGNPTGVNAVEELTGNGIEAVYNAAGVKQNGMQKGVNIVRLANGKTITVIVK